MLKLLQAHLGIYSLDKTRIHSIVSNRQISLIKVLLRKGKHQDRRLLLEKLLQTRFFVPEFIPPLLHILAKDSIANAEKALQILEERLSQYPKYTNRFDAARKTLQDKRRRKENRQLVQDRFQIKNTATLDERKGQMNRLAKVKTDVKKGMSRMG